MTARRATAFDRVLTIRDLPASERPRERLIALGAEALSQQELLSCILGRGITGEPVTLVAHRLLHAFDGLQGLADASIEQLSTIRGIGPAKATQLKACLELGRRLRPAPMTQPVETAAQAAALVRPLASLKKEHFVALLLDTRHRLIRQSVIAIGTLSASLVHPRELFKEAIGASAAAVIVAHNHPSGDPQPSDHDLALTARLSAAGRLLGIELLDHLIVGATEVVSLKALGALEG